MINKTINKNVYKTKDIFIASTLFAQGVKLISTDWVNGECFFCFADEEKSEEMARKYFADEIKISPRTLFNSFKDIKSILFNGR